MWTPRYAVDGRMGAFLCRYICAGWGEIFGKLRYSGAQMMLECQGWSCKPPHSASHIHIIYRISVLASWHVVERHMGAPLWWWGFMEIWGTVEPEWCFNVVVEAVHHPTLHLTSILHVYDLFWYIDMLWMGKWVHPYTDTPVQAGGILICYGKLML